ncbi:hypothetical protein GGR51DRAFT_543126 [Nemania sp. FL0031]|nr:hypothetical protein GGR51DRAFT_543126 [Nemania sp. FL0031]
MAVTMAAILFVAILGGVIAAPATPLEAKILAANGNTTILETQLAPAWATTSPIRSTASLLWTSILTLSIAVYSLNIHGRSLPPSLSLGDYIRAKIFIAVKIVFLLEGGIVLAIEEFLLARALQRELQPFAKQHRGGFGLTYCFYAVMGGFTRKDNKAIIKPTALIYLAKEKGRFIQPENNIEARGHADGLAKALICVQVGWMVIQCIGRTSMNLPVSLLEIHVLAYVVCALIVYGLWFQKPLDVALPTEVDSDLLNDVPAEYFAEDSSEKGFYSFNQVSSSEIARGEAPSDTYISLIVIYGGYFAYCAIHLAAWRYHFPTETEMWLWRGSSLLVITLYPFAVIIYSIISYIAPGNEDLLPDRPPPWVEALVVIFRLLLLIEAFISLRQMPIGVFVTIDWSNYIPHL